MAWPLNQVIADEIKVVPRIGCDDLRSQRQLKERLGERLEEAIVLYTGVQSYDGWVTVRPLDRLWS